MKLIKIILFIIIVYAIPYTNTVDYITKCFVSTKSKDVTYVSIMRALDKIDYYNYDIQVNDPDIGIVVIHATVLDSIIDADSCFVGHNLMITISGNYVMFKYFNFYHFSNNKRYSYGHFKDSSNMPASNKKRSFEIVQHKAYLQVHKMFDELKYLIEKELVYLR